MLLLAFLLAATPEPVLQISPELRAEFKLSPHYQKVLFVDRFPIVASSSVADPAFREAKVILEAMLINHREYLDTLANAKIRLAIMSTTELTTDLPEHSDLTPKEFWDRRARGLGATYHRPAVSCGEENLLGYPGDPYVDENLLIHEFAHALHEIALPKHLPDFGIRVRAAYEAARARGTWKNTYAMTDEKEYWAEAVQSWFDTNRVNDKYHGWIDKRSEVQRADPGISKLIVEALGDVRWRYKRPSRRTRAELRPLGDLPDPRPRFIWPDLPHHRE